MDNARKLGVDEQFRKWGYTTDQTVDMWSITQQDTHLKQVFSVSLEYSMQMEKMKWESEERFPSYLEKDLSFFCLGESLRDFKQRSGRIILIFQKDCCKFIKENWTDKTLKNRGQCRDHWTIKIDLIKTWTKGEVVIIKRRGQMWNLDRIMWLIKYGWWEVHYDFQIFIFGN